VLNDGDCLLGAFSAADVIIGANEILGGPEFV